MESGLKSLSKLFTERLFRIPDFQRGYSWKTKQLKEFWGDLEQLEKGRHHYLGVLTLEVVSEKSWAKWQDDEWLIRSKSFIPYHVVDGQQRLTTIIILLQCIVEKMRAGDLLNYSSKEEIQAKFIHVQRPAAEGSFLFGYERDNPSYEYLKTKILQRTSTKYAAGESTIYTKNLANAKSYLHGRISELKKEALEILFTKVTQQLLFNVFNIEKDVDVHVAFETMNNRGLQLSNLELLKNRLIYLTTKLGEPPANVGPLRSDINNAWKTVYYYLGKNPSASLSDDYFLQIHFLLHYAKELLERHPKYFEHNTLHHAAEVYKDFLLEERFTVRRLNSPKGEERITSTTLYQYAIDLKRTVEHYYYISFPEDGAFSEEEKLWLSRLQRLFMASQSREIFVLLLLLIPRKEGVGDRVQILQTMESYFFITSVLPYRFKKKNLTLQVGRELMRCAAKETSLQEVVSKIEQQMSDFRGDPSHAEAVLEGLGERGYYDWDDLKYFMYEYECHLKARARRKSDKIDWETFIQDSEEDHSSIEHILPQSPTDPYWRGQLKGLTSSQIKKLTNSLGNLVATSGSRNASLGNRSFKEKVGAQDRKTSYRFGSYSEIEVSLHADWGPQQILSRGLTLIDFMCERWGLRFHNETAKIKQLGLDFLKLS